MPATIISIAYIDRYTHICYSISMNDKPNFQTYTRKNGVNEFNDFIASLPTKDADKLVALIRVIESEGMLTAFRQQWIKRVDSDIFEIRSKVSSNIQRVLYFHKRGNEYIITHGFTKKSQKTPSAEIDKAHRILKEWRDEYVNH